MLLRIFHILGSSAIVACVVIIFSSQLLFADVLPGDLDLDGVPFELDDAGIYAEYFSIGLPAFTIDPASQITASDANEDGLTLSVADYVFILRVLWGEGYPPVEPSDTIQTNLRLIDIPQKRKIAPRFDGVTERLIMQFDISTTTVTNVALLPPYDEVFMETETTDNNLIIRLSGLSLLAVGSTLPSMLEIDYEGDIPTLTYNGGIGENDEAVTLSFISANQRGDVNLNGIRFEIADIVMLTNVMMGIQEFDIDMEGQLYFSDADQDGIPMTAADYEYFMAVIENRIDPDYVVEAPFDGHLVISQNENVMTIASAMDYKTGAVLLNYHVTNLTALTPIPGANTIDMVSSYNQHGDTLTILLNGNLVGGYIESGAADVFRLEYTADDLELISSEVAGFDARTVDLTTIGRGDANGDGTVNIGDAVTIIHIIFEGFPAGLWQELAMDANCDGVYNVGDAVFLVNYIFKGGPSPGCF